MAGRQGPEFERRSRTSSSTFPLKRLGKSEPTPTPTTSPATASPPLDSVAKTPDFSSRVEQDKLLKLGCWVRGLRLLKRSLPSLTSFYFLIQ